MKTEWVAFLSSIILSMTPILDNYKKGEISLLGGIYYSLMWLNYMSWLSYSILQNNDKWASWSGNFWGVIVTTFYCYNISANQVDKTYVNISYNVNIGCFIIGIGILLLSFYSTNCTIETFYIIKDFIGKIASFICILWNICPNYILPFIITKGTHITSKYFSLETVIIYNISSLLNCIYGVLLDDNFMVFCNLIGGMTNLLCLLALLSSIQQRNRYSSSIKSSSSGSSTSSLDTYDNTNVTNSGLCQKQHYQPEREQEPTLLLLEQEEGRGTGIRTEKKRE